MNSLSFPPFYLSAPTSPGDRSPHNLRFYSTTSSPRHQVGDQKTSDDEEFDFGSSRKLPDGWLPSISTMAYADELFCDGQVLPLKLPPRLQRSVPTSPTAVRPRTRSPFSHRCKWNDDFDPFMIALEKVSEEPSGRISVHRRSRSFSPFRARTIESDQKEPITTTIKNQIPTARAMVKRLRLGADLSHEPVKPLKNSSFKESKMQKVKSVLLRYASEKKEATKTNEKREIMTIVKVSYFKRLNLSLKTNYRRKKESMESKMGIKDKLLQTISDRIGIRH